MSKKHKVVYAPHGFNPEIVSPEVWQSVVWGNPGDGVFGRHSYALYWMFKSLQWGHDAFIYLGQGPKLTSVGTTEAEVTYGYFSPRLNEVPGYSQRMQKEFGARVVFDQRDSLTTGIEVLRCIQYCLDNAVDELVFISSRFHGSRSMRDGNGNVEILEERAAGNLGREWRPLPLHITWKTAHTNPPRCSARGIDLVEPPVSSKVVHAGSKFVWKGGDYWYRWG